MMFCADIARLPRIVRNMRGHHHHFLFDTHASQSHLYMYMYSINGDCAACHDTDDDRRASAREMFCAYIDMEIYIN